MNGNMIELLTAADMYRAIRGWGPPVWPRHYTHFSCAFTGTLWTICPIETDADVRATIESGSNFMHQVTPFWAYFEARDGRREPPRPCFDMIHAYLVHCMFAPCWTEVYDQWLERNGREPWRLWSLAQEHSMTLIEVETPAELVEWLERALHDGFDFLSPATQEEIDFVAGLTKPRGRTA